MCFGKVLTSSAVVMTMELHRRRMNWESEKGLTADRDEEKEWIFSKNLKRTDWIEVNPLSFKAI